MKMRVFLACAALTAVAAIAVERKTVAQTDLKVSFGASGVQQLSYRGVTLEDLAQNPSDAFHIWHMKISDLNGNVLTSSQYGWGETNQGKAWDAGNQTWTYSFPWGSIAVQFQQSGNTLNMNVTEKNLQGSNVVLNGAEILPLALHFPRLPVGFSDQSYPQLSYNTTGPSVVGADFASGMVTAVVPSALKPLYSGFMPAGSPNAYTALISSTAPDGLATFQPHKDRSVLPGQTDSFTVSLRFSPSGTAVATLAADAYRSWASTWPAQLHWTDRRIIGTVYLASSATGNVNQPAGFPNNPRRYFNDSQASDFDVTKAAGLAKFQQRILAQAASNVQNLQRLNAQGAITWDLEGEQYPQETSYVCSPDQIAAVAPEMESIIQNPGSPYAGMKLDDAYFKMMRDAGFRVGVCIRPQHFTLKADGTAAQVYLPDAQIAAEIIGKMQYAHSRWGATLFYIDSTVEQNGAVLDASIFQQAAAALPDSLLIPEESAPKFYAYTAPFQSFIFHGDLGTESSVHGYYPSAFSANLINDVDPAKLAAAQTQLTAAVRSGDVLMVHADYWQDNNTTVMKIYQAAGVTAPAAVVTPVVTSQPDPSSGSANASTSVQAPPVAPTSAPATPVASAPVATTGVVITSPTSGSTIAGDVTVVAQINLSLDAAGSYLMVDGQEIGTRRVSEGPFQYALDTTMLAEGAHTLQIWAHDTANEAVLSGTVQITVANASATSPSPISAPASPSTSTASTSAPVASTPISSAGAPPAPAAPSSFSSPIALTYPLSGQGVSGVIEVTAAIPQTLDAAGSYLMVDGAQASWQRVGSAPYLYRLDTSALSAGAHTLQVWAHDVGNDTLLSNQAVVMVTH